MLNLQPASFEDFEREAARGTVVPVVRSVLADLQTPVGAFLRVGRDARYSFLLESIEGGERIARYSFLGADPETVVRGRGDETVVERNGERETRGVRVTEFVRDYFRRRKLARRPGLAPLAGGAVGYLTYDGARLFEAKLQAGDKNVVTDDAVWMFYRTLIAFDRVRQRMEITSVVVTDEAGGSRTRLRDLYDQAVEETARLEKILQGSVPSPEREETGAESGDGAAFESNWAKENFEDAVRAAKEYIAAGDCYQVVLSQRFTKKVSVEPLAVYRALRVLNPSPYMYFLRADDQAIIGASPEMLVRCRGQRLDQRPVAGSRKRGATEAEDWLLGEEMRADEREVAEHTLLVDLARNDLGRVSDYGSVEVDDLMGIGRYSYAQHLVSSLRSRLRDDLDRFDALASCFPAGAVTGAPKVRAMEIIRALELERRGVYGGAILYMDYAENLDSCAATRAIIIKDGRATVQAGANVVADSVPEREYEETVNKARDLVGAIEMAERGL